MRHSIIYDAFTLLFGISVGFMFALVIKFSPSLNLMRKYGHHAVDFKEEVGFHEGRGDSHAYENISIVNQLYDDVRIFCLIFTTPENHETNALLVNITWGRRCHKILFVTSGNTTDSRFITLQTSEGSDYQWERTKEAFQYVYDHHLNDADWFLKADDDT